MLSCNRDYPLIIIFQKYTPFLIKFDIDSRIGHIVAITVVALRKKRNNRQGISGRKGELTLTVVFSGG